MRSTTKAASITHSRNNLEMHDGGSKASKEIAVKLTDGKTKKMQSRSNKLWVKYSYTALYDTTDGGFAFKLTFAKKGALLTKKGNGKLAFY